MTPSPLGPRPRTLHLQGRRLHFSPAPGRPEHFCVGDGEFVLTLPRADAWNWAVVSERIRGFDVNLAGGMKLPPELSAPDTWRVCRELRRWHQPALTFTVWQGPEREATEFSVWAPQGTGRGLDHGDLAVGTLLPGDPVSEWREVRRLWRQLFTDQGEPDPLVDCSLQQRLARKRQDDSNDVWNGEARELPF